jgi:hypothetical protein
VNPELSGDDAESVDGAADETVQEFRELLRRGLVPGYQIEDLDEELLLDSDDEVVY